jgi:hypothetical protein
MVDVNEYCNAVCCSSCQQFHVSCAASLIRIIAAQNWETPGVHLTDTAQQHKDQQLNLLKPTGHVMHQQFNIQQLYVLPTLYLCVLYLSENKQRLVPLTA